VSYKPQMMVGRVWCGNAFVFATEAEGLAYARGIHSRYAHVEAIRAIESDATVTHAFVDGQLCVFSELLEDTQ
jgi:hypothetical protein